MQTIKQKNDQTISKNLFELLTKKVSKINKRNNLKALNQNDIKQIKDLDVILGVYSCSGDDKEIFLVYKVFISSDLLLKGSFKQYNLIANSLLKKNQGRDKITPKINIYNNVNNESFLNTFIEFIKNKLNQENLDPGEYEMQGLKLGDLLELEI